MEKYFNTELLDYLLQKLLIQNVGIGFCFAVIMILISFGIFKAFSMFKDL